MSATRTTPPTIVHLTGGQLLAAAAICEVRGNHTLANQLTAAALKAFRQYPPPAKEVKP